MYLSNNLMLMRPAIEAITIKITLIVINNLVTLNPFLLILNPQSNTTTADMKKYSAAVL